VPAARLRPGHRRNQASTARSSTCAAPQPSDLRDARSGRVVGNRDRQWATAATLSSRCAAKPMVGNHLERLEKIRRARGQSRRATLRAVPSALTISEIGARRAQARRDLASAGARYSRDTTLILTPDPCPVHALPGREETTPDVIEGRNSCSTTSTGIAPTFTGVARGAARGERAGAALPSAKLPVGLQIIGPRFLGTDDPGRGEIRQREAHPLGLPPTFAL